MCVIARRLGCLHWLAHAAGRGLVWRLCAAGRTGVVELDARLQPVVLSFVRVHPESSTSKELCLLYVSPILPFSLPASSSAPLSLPPSCSLLPHPTHLLSLSSFHPHLLSSLFRLSPSLPRSLLLSLLSRYPFFSLLFVNFSPILPRSLSHLPPPFFSVSFLRRAESSREVTSQTVSSHKTNSSARR